MTDDPAKIELLRELIRQLGIDPSSLLPAQSAPTVSAYLPQVLAAASPSQQRRYGVHWTRAVDAFGGRRVDQVTPSDVVALQRLATRQAHVRSNTRKGRYAGECAVRAMRMFFRLATADGLLTPGANPAEKVEIERRLPNVRRALTPKEMMAINHIVVTTDRDVALDSLLLRLHIETACRRSGALGLRLVDLDSESCAVRLRRSSAPNAGNRSVRHWPLCCTSTRNRGERDTVMTSFCGTRTAPPCPGVATTCCGSGCRRIWLGPGSSVYRHIGCATPL